jgi:hypothetical protein
VLRSVNCFKPIPYEEGRHSHDAPGFQLVDFFLGAALADWQGDATSDHKLRVRRYVAAQLGWPDMRSDTHPDIWKFNVWYFYDRTGKREVPTRPVKIQGSYSPVSGWSDAFGTGLRLLAISCRPPPTSPIASAATPQEGPDQSIPSAASADIAPGPAKATANASAARASVYSKPPV